MNQLHQIKQSFQELSKSKKELFKLLKTGAKCQRYCANAGSWGTHVKACKPSKLVLSSHQLNEYYDNNNINFNHKKTFSEKESVFSKKSYGKIVTTKCQNIIIII